MVSPEPRRLSRVDSGAAGVPEALPRPWSGRILRAKLRRPDLPRRVVPRPRLLARIDDGARPLTLIVAAAGFGKTTAAAEWAHRAPPAAWLAADAADASLHRFWAHLCAALAGVAPGFGELVTASLEIPHRAPVADLGHLLADELLDAPNPVRLVIDDVHLVAPGEVFDFLAGLLEIAPQGFRLVVTARSEPPLPLTRLRLRGMTNDIRGSDLLFTEDEARTLVAHAIPGQAGSVVNQHTATLWQRTRGWAAGLRLAAISTAGDASPGVDAAAAESSDSRLLTALLEETLDGRSPQERAALVRAALPDRFDVHLVASLADVDEPFATTREAIRFALAADLCRPSTRFGGDWLEFHPLFREALLRHLEAEETPGRVAHLHARAAAWFEATGLLDGAIEHRFAAGEIATAISLVERELQGAFAREDWPAIARWLALLPQDVTRDRPELLLASGWLAHLRGQATTLGAVLGALEERLSRGDPVPDVEALRAEMTLLTLSSLVPLQVDAEGSVAIARQAIAVIPPSRRYPLGMAHAMLGGALQALGRSAEASDGLTSWTDASSTGVDAGTVRGLLGLLFIHAQAGQLARVESVARTTRELTERHRLRLTFAWTHRFLGDVHYERDELEEAIEHYAVVARDHEYFHVTGLREALFGLALAYIATGRRDDATRAMRRSREIVVAAGTIEHLPAIEAHEAYLAFRGGNVERALNWAKASHPSIDSATLHVTLHPAVIRATILCAGAAAEVDEAIVLLTTLRDRAERAHFAGPLVRIDGLLAVAHEKRGERAAALAAMRRSLATGAPQGFMRSYLDLLPTFAPELRRLATGVAFPPALRVALEPSAVASVRVAATAPFPPIEHLTGREHEVLVALFQRLSYKEIADQLYISPLTVKRHASSIYSKLGVSGRLQAVQAALELGWQPSADTC